MAIRLGDDGTMDTVLVCEECGEEMRYNYDGGECDHHEDCKSEACARDLYEAFVDWAIEDATEDHICGEEN